MNGRRDEELAEWRPTCHPVPRDRKGPPLEEHDTVDGDPNGGGRWIEIKEAVSCVDTLPVFKRFFLPSSLNSLS